MSSRPHIMKTYLCIIALALLTSGCGNLVENDVRRYSERDACWEPVSVWEGLLDRTCTQGSTYAKRGRKYYRFPTGCLPWGFEEVSSSDPELEARISTGYCN